MTEAFFLMPGQERELFLAKGRTRLVTRSGMDGEAWEGWAVSLDPKREEGRGSAEAEQLIACPYREGRRT